MTELTDFSVDFFRMGDRVQVHPSTNLWMRGARYGTVMWHANGAKTLIVKLDALLRDRIISRDDIGLVEDNGDWQ